MTSTKVPQYHELMWPALTALKELGGSATVKEMYKKVVEDEAFTEEQQALSTKDGRMSEIEYRLHWARTHLKGIGAITNSARGVWTITEKGKTITSEQVQANTKAWRAQVQLKVKERPDGVQAPEHSLQNQRRPGGTSSSTGYCPSPPRASRGSPSASSGRRASPMSLSSARVGTAGSTASGCTGCHLSPSPSTSSARGTKEP